ncbi:malto-oligosyltrehalose synthase [Flexivirga oryzae]|uniref:(1->4)-alpha-D-glucan 1-alpha-D-glucosylmutase n=1 Tax=Flexivirga oryzae TaxID=1794944 RepID=A0A839NA30_9MICO|nr:malto-oligosyltrehalose synthase [Flexivirga oryzae]MBB2892844.1 (1->4)-alpha-D-glucan 1-alpha-D-glucosylmutase [Flexivirga oryzae]
MARDVTGTYRLQLHAGFTFADAATQLDYLATLGVSHVYLSPILQAAPGSMHGYDVVDHSRISDELGGRGAFEQFATAAHSRGLGIVVDVVPNHMAISAPESLNKQLWELLRDGRDAATAHWFDIDWKAGGGRIGLPFLGKPLGEVLADGEITLDRTGDEPVLRYYDHSWPLSVGTDTTDDVAELLERQHYRLAHWRAKDDVLNYRRFFEVDTLIAIRVEQQDVFDATHALLLELNDKGLIDGFRIDHPDGLADPTGYLERLSDKRSRGTKVWIEKILEPGETLPRGWKCAGTTGYDALRVIQSALADPEPVATLRSAWTAAGGDPDYTHAVDVAKRHVISRSLQPEVSRLTRRAAEALPDLEAGRLREAIVELLVASPVYRAYVRPGHRTSSVAHDLLDEAHATAVAARPDLRAELDALQPLTMLGDEGAAALDFAVRLQQTWGPVMAKGIEDTTFYRWAEFVAMNEVGSDPSRVGESAADELHTWSTQQQSKWPLTMTTLSTHDTKRSEDVRARLIAVGGDPQSWQAISRESQKAAKSAKVDPRTAHFVWQTLLGVGPIDDERLSGYLRKALREASLKTTWTDQDPAYEQQVIDFATSVSAGGPVRDAIDTAIDRNRNSIRALTLGAKLLQMTMPGVPDIYQGTELVDLALVDPDNRRPVDFDARAELLVADTPTGTDAEKLHVVTAALHARRAHPRVFGPESSYRPAVSSSEHVVGFTRSAPPGRLTGAIGRGGRETFLALATRAPARLERSGGWADATLDLASGEWRDHLSDVTLTSDGQLAVADVLRDWPVALLEHLV